MSWEKITIKQEWVTEIKQTLSRYPNAAIVQYLSHFGLPVFGPISFLIERIIHAMLIAEQLKGNAQIGLRKRFPMPVGANFNVLHDQIKSLLEAGKKIPDFEELMKFIDELAMNGRQHIFFYQIGRNGRGYLDEIRKKPYILKSLKKFRCGGCYNKNRFIWEAKSPKLAEVRHKYESGRGELLLKWIETRSWLNFVNQDEGPPIFVPCKERSVNFFRVNLKDGTAEIRLQRLNSNPDKSLLEQNEIYREKIQRLLGFDFLFAVPLDPVMKRLLKSRDMHITFWDVRLKGKSRGKDKLSGSTDPSIFNRLELGFRKYSSRKIHGDWTNLDRIWGPEKVHTEFSGSNNEILLTKPCDALQLASVLRIVRGFELPRIKIPEIKRLVKKRKDLKPILMTIDRDLAVSEEKKVSATELEDLWFKMKVIMESFLELSKTSSKFEIQKNKKDQLLIYEPMPGGLIGWMEERLGKKFSKTSEMAIPALVYLLSIIGLCWITAKLFLPMLKGAGVGFPLIALTYLIVTACILAFAFLIFGREEIKEAVKLIIDLIKGTGLGKFFRRKHNKELATDE